MAKTAKKAYNSQSEFLYAYLRGTGRTITAKQARKKYGIKCLTARMSELRAEGLKVRTSRTNKGELAYAVSARDVNGSRAKIEKFAF